MPTVKENLIAARALIDAPEKWASTYHERFQSGVVERLDAIDACERVTGDFSLSRHLRDVLPDDAWTVTMFNNSSDTTHSDMMALFDRAIAAQ